MFYLSDKVSIIKYIFELVIQFVYAIDAFWWFYAISIKFNIRLGFNKNRSKILSLFSQIKKDYLI